MAISFFCECGFKIRAPESMGGRRGRCPQCKQSVNVPMPAPKVAAPKKVEDDSYDLAEALGVPTPSAPDPAADDGGIAFADTAPAKPLTVAAKPRTSIRSSSTRSAIAGAPPTPPAVTLHATLYTPPAAFGIRRHLYWILLLVLVPLAWSTLHRGVEDKHTINDRLEQTIKLHPEVEERLANLPDEATLRDLCDVLPNDRLEGALLPERTKMHWAFAAASGVVFLAAALLIFPAGHAKIWHLAGVGVLTGTLGILLLLGVQWLAFHTNLYVGRSIITLILDLLWLIGQSYRMALDDRFGFWLSFLGFTAGVGFCEEACKALPLLFKAKGSGFSSWRSAMLWGLVSGIGFGVSEGVTYSVDYYNGVSGADAYVVRFVSCVGLHGIWAAAVAITIFHRQERFRHAENLFEWLFETVKAVIVPMVLHGLYDTLLKQDHDVWALVVALASFGWLAFQIERTTRTHGEPDAPVAMA